MKTYRIEMTEITANTKKEAVEKYITQHWASFRCLRGKSFSTLYRKTILINKQQHNAALPA